MCSAEPVSLVLPLPAGRTVPLGSLTQELTVSSLVSKRGVHPAFHLGTSFRGVDAKSPEWPPSSTEPYGRGAGFPIWDQATCEGQNPTNGCERYLAMYYPKCKAGFHAVGCCICSPDWWVSWQGLSDINLLGFGMRLSAHYLDAIVIRA